MAEGKLTPPQRQQQILSSLLRKGGSVSAAHVAELFGVSLMTAHRDLDALERSGFARKFHGGITPLPASMFDSSVEFRLRAKHDEKVAIARLARKFVEPGMSVLLEDSTTNLALAETLVGVAPLTVITNYPPIAQSFKGHADVSLIMLGGEYFVNRDAYLGLHCVRAVDTIRASIYFSSTAAMSTTQAFHSDPEVVMVKRAMMRSAERKVLMMDNSKIGNSALHIVADLVEFDDIVVDSRVDPQILATLRQSHPGVHVATPAGDARRGRRSQDKDRPSPEREHQ